MIILRRLSMISLCEGVAISLRGPGNGGQPTRHLWRKLLRRHRCTPNVLVSTTPYRDLPLDNGNSVNCVDNNHYHLRPLSHHPRPLSHHPRLVSHQPRLRVAPPVTRVAPPATSCRTTRDPCRTTLVESCRNHPTPVTPPATSCRTNRHDLSHLRRLCVAPPATPVAPPFWYLAATTRGPCRTTRDFVSHQPRPLSHHPCGILLQRTATPCRTILVATCHTNRDFVSHLPRGDLSHQPRLPVAPPHPPWRPVTTSEFLLHHRRGILPQPPATSRRTTRDFVSHHLWHRVTTRDFVSHHLVASCHTNVISRRNLRGVVPSLWLCVGNSGFVSQLVASCRNSLRRAAIRGFVPQLVASCRNSWRLAAPPMSSRMLHQH